MGCGKEVARANCLPASALQQTPALARKGPRTELGLHLSWDSPCSVCLARPPGPPQLCSQNHFRPTLGPAARCREQPQPHDTEEGPWEFQGSADPRAAVRPLLGLGLLAAACLGLGQQRRHCASSPPVFSSWEACVTGRHFRGGCGRFFSHA